MRNLNLILQQVSSELKPSFFGNDPEGLQMLHKIVADFKTKNNHSKAERESFNSIESIRKQLLQSKDYISVVDYGAGSNILQTLTDNKNEAVKEVCRTSSKSAKACLFLYNILKTTQPKNAIELGTCLGISTSYQAISLKNYGYKGSKLLTIEGSPDRHALAEKTLKQAGLTDFTETDQGLFEAVLRNKLPEKGPLDYIFIDGHHEENATIKYFEMVFPFMNKNGGIMVFDDIFWSAGMCRAWNTVLRSDKIKAGITYLGMGVIVV